MGIQCIGDNRTKYHFLFLQDIIMCIQFIAEFSELIHVDKRKDRPESTSSSVELCSLFDKVIHLSRCDALVKSVCLESLKYSILRD